MEPFINDLSNKTFTEDLVQISSLLSVLLRTPQTIDLFLQKKELKLYVPQLKISHFK